MITDEVDGQVSNYTVTINPRDMKGKETFLTFNNDTRELLFKNLTEEVVGKYDLEVEVVDKHTNKPYQMKMELIVNEI